MKNTLIIVLVVLVSAGCTRRSFAPAAEQLPVMQQKVPGITLERAQAGYRLYEQQCAGCHQLYPPGKYTIAQWNTILPKMFVKAKLTAKTDQDLIRDYLHALSR